MGEYETYMHGCNMLQLRFHVVIMSWAIFTLLNCIGSNSELLLYLCICWVIWLFVLKL